MKFLKKYLCLTVLIAISLTGAASAQTGNQDEAKQPKPLKPVSLYEGEGYHYKILWQDKLAGYSKFFVSKKLSLAGSTFYQIDSVSDLKIGMGDINHLTFASKTTLQAEGLKPTYFNINQKQEDIRIGVDCLVSKNVIAQTFTASGERNNVTIPLSENEETPYIYVNNLWGRVDTMVEHYWILLQAGRTGKIFVYDPVLQFKGHIEIIEEKPENIKIAGKTISAKVFKINDFKGNNLLNIWTDSRKKILKMQEPGGGIAFELTDNSVAEQLKKTTGVDVWENRASKSNIFFPNAGKINFVKADLEVSGRGISADTVKAPGFSQEFSGESSENLIKGTFTVKTEDSKIKNTHKFPIEGDYAPEMTEYKKPEIGIESDEDIVKAKALEATWKAEDVWEAAQKINTWVYEKIPEGIALPSARMTITNEQGNSESKAMLAVALCRAMGIPARKTGGVVFIAGNFVPHYWFEAYMGEAGWAPLDPAFNEAGKLNASHIKLYNDGEIWSLNVKVKDFNPKPPAKVSYINKEITWPVGETRTYSVIKSGAKVGEETAKMKDISILGENEVYRMNLSSKLTVEDRTTDAVANFSMSPEGLPVRYEKTLTRGERKDKQIFQAKEGGFLWTNVTKRGDVNMDIPISEGVYMADPNFLCEWALIGGQFPSPSMGKTYDFSVFIPETFSVENISAMVKQLEPVDVGEKIYDAFRIETNKGIVLWIEKGTSKIIKVTFKQDEVDLELVSSKFEPENPAKQPILPTEPAKIPENKQQ